MKIYLLALLLYGVLVGCNNSSTHVVSDPSGPDSKVILCKALGVDPHTERLCGYTTDEELRKLLLSVYPIGTATQVDVHTHLSIYLLKTESTETRIFEYYAIEQTLFPEAPVKAIFAFDKQGILRQLDIVDIL